MEVKKLKVIIAVTGASGAIYAQLMFKKLEALKDQIEGCGVVFSDCAKDVWKFELGNDSFKKIPFRIYEKDDFFAPFASGSAGYDIMIICPCTMGTMGRIAAGISNDLITRTADVMLKERKKLILVTREMPLSLIHINNMKALTECGAVICPASPSFYSSANKIDDILQTVIDKVLILAGFKFGTFQWGTDGK